MKLIDGDVLVAIFANCPEGDFSSAEVARTIDNAPTIDAEPVVRCGECWTRTCAGYRDLYCWKKGAPSVGRNVKPDDFCSYGQRKEEPT